MAAAAMEKTAAAMAAVPHFAMGYQSSEAQASA